MSHFKKMLALEVSTNLWLFIQLPPALLPVCRFVSSYLFQAFMTALCVYVNWMHLVVTSHVSCQRHCPLLGKGRSGCWEPKSRPCLCVDGARDGAFHLVLFIQQTETWLYTRLSPLDLPLHGINSCDVEVLKNFHTVDEISGLRLGPAPAAFQRSWRVLTLPGTCVSLQKWFVKSQALWNKFCGVLRNPVPPLSPKKYCTIGEASCRRWHALQAGVCPWPRCICRFTEDFCELWSWTPSQ